ncbi:MAG: carbohydrate ABC transporter permease [Clostridia bacterium]|nr:carbohydrate ABC transporter permease [Clostridiales bacterium]MDD7166535.1 carbohydrate ABC transporter permease [Clostridia bacterium]MDY2900424.1 carbohydrate ABC transporter permease [Christensenellaceae bacterium]
MKKYKSDRAFDIVNGLIIALLCVTFILPFWMMIISSFTEEISLRVNGYKLFPSAFSAAGYEYIFSSPDYNILRAIINSVIISVSGTVLSVAVSLITAYALSKKYVVGIKGINVFYIITMFFAGGTIPLYLVIRGIGLYDTIWALIIPSMFSLYHIILVRSYFYSLPAALEEAAMIDGANDFKILVSVFLPISVPMVLTIAFFMFVDRWNSWMDALLYLGQSEKSKSLRPLQFVLKQILENSENSGGLDGSAAITPVLSAKSAAVVIAIAPLLAIFPIIQRYFVNGITIGAVKG